MDMKNIEQKRKSESASKEDAEEEKTLERHIEQK